MKVSLTNNDVVAAIQAYLVAQMPTLADADIALDYSLTRAPHSKLSIDVLVGADAEDFRAQQDELAANAKPHPRKKVAAQVEETEEVAEEEELQEEEEAEKAPAAKSRFQRK